MLAKVLTRIFGSKYERDHRRMAPVIDEINRYVENFRALSDEQLRGKTGEFRQRIAGRLEGIEDDKERTTAEEELLEEILPEAFGAVKEACRRLLGKRWPVCGIEVIWDMVPFDVQLMGGVVLHQGKIAEMATGEGKTLVATMPLYLNALLGRGAHLVTVNDYLARRDSEWMGEIYRFLGLTVGCIQNHMDPSARKIQYGCDVTYGTNNEFGFDYLRDNMAVRAEDRVQRGHQFAIVDEVDSVLIDEARTPLIISGAVEHSSHRFDELKGPVQRLVEQQSLLVNRIVADGEVLLEQGKEYEAAVKFLQARRGSPKNNRLLKLEKEKGVFKLIQRAELDYMRDKRLGELDEELYFAIDEKGHVVDLSEKGRNKLAPRDPGLFVLPDLSTGLHQIEGDETLSPGERLERKAKLEQEYVDKSEKLQNISQLLRAYCLFEKDVEYVVSEGKVLIVDEFTGRLMPGRRFSDGLHQALEAKESVAIERETQTLATITVQNYFRLYRKLAGMTGTAETEAGEFWEIYKLDVVVVPTNEPVRRVDCDDVVFKTRREKYNAVIDEIARIHERGLPILVGTVSVDVSETLSRMLQRRGIKHAVLNAKYHQQEAEIVSRAGQAGTVTIATNMAGRGTDIKLGPGVVKSPNCTLIAPPRQGQPCPYYEDLKCDDDVPCGLHIVGTERHEARRIDRQLRGRAGRQGDPGSSRFFLSLEDDLMRLFGSDRIASVMDRLGAKEGEAIEHPLVTRSIGTAQKRVETHNFDIRKHLLEYDDVMNKQREAIYELRGRVLEGEDLKGRIQEMIEDVVDSQLEAFTDPKAYPENWDWANLRLALEKFFLIDLALPQDQRQGLKVEDFREMILERAGRQYETKEQVVGADLMRQLERAVMLQVIDTRWRDHLYAMDLMKEGIGLRAYGQKDPLLEYKQEAYDMFAELTRGLNEDIVGLVYRAQLVRPEEEGRPQAPVRAYKPTIPVPEDAAQREREPVFGRMAARGRDQERGRRREEDAPRLEPVRSEPKVGRNDPCPCGSGKKYKKCCGA